MKVEELVAAHIQQMTADGRAVNTIQQARRHGLLIARYFGERDVVTITHVDVARFLTSAMALRTFDGRVRRPTSANALRSSVRTLFGYANAAGFAPTNAAGLVRRARCGSPLPKALNDGDREKLLGALAEAETPAEVRDRVLVTVLLTAGPRIGSTLAADVRDFDASAGTIHLRGTKNGDDATVFLPRETARMLADHVGARTDGPLFVGANGARLGTRQAHRRLARWTKRAGIDRTVGPHSLRHSFAVALLRKTGNVVLVGKALAHRSLASTMVYARCSDAEVRSAVGA